MSSLPLTGGCLCGGVRYEIDAPLVSASYCHCKRCQRRSGAAASAQGRLAPGSLRIVSGADLLRSWDPDDGGFAKAFCSVCGSAMFSRPPGANEYAAVRLGSFDGDPGIRPGHHQWVQSAAVWEPLADDGLPRYGGRPPSS
jgi:hypothetical protein